MARPGLATQSGFRRMRTCIAELIRRETRRDDTSQLSLSKNTVIRCILGVRDGSGVWERVGRIQRVHSPKVVVSGRRRWWTWEEGKAFICVTNDIPRSS